jgi:hypothetical protein
VHEDTPLLRGTDIIDASEIEGGTAAAAAAAPPPRLFGRPLPDGLWRHRWAVFIVAWAGAATLIYLTAGDNLNPYLTLTGLLVGFLVGLTGMGGGALMTPILIIFFGFKPTMAIGTDVTYAAVTKWFGAWRHRKQGSVDLPLSLWLAAGSIPMALVGVSLVDYLKNNYGDVLDSILYRALGTALVAVSALLVVRVVMKIDKQHRRENVPLSWKRKLATVAIGAGTGFVIGLTSVGSGTFLAIFLIVFYPLTTDRIVGTDIFHAALLLTVTGVAQWSVGNVDLYMVAALLMGSIPGVILGSHLTLMAPTRVLRICLAVVLFLSGLAMFSKA